MRVTTTLPAAPRGRTPQGIPDHRRLFRPHLHVAAMAALSLVGCSLAALVLPAAAQDGWDVRLPRGQTREIDFTTTEGTRMSVDVAPDGSWVVFDLLGHIYRVPAEGGAAESLTQESGVAVNYHPRVSPDGGSIAFISDRGGQDNLWVMDADGSNARAVFHDLNSRAVTPAWTPDGEFIVVRRDPIGRGGVGENGLGIWMHHRNGGAGVRLVDDGGAHWPSVSPDGQCLADSHLIGVIDVTGT